MSSARDTTSTCQMPVIAGRELSPEPGTHEHRPEEPSHSFVLTGSGPGPTGRPGMTGVSSVWRLLARVRGADAASAVFALLDEATDAVSAFETGTEEWGVEAYPQSPLLTLDLRARAALAAVAADGTLVDISEEKLPARDWLAENQAAFPPLRIGQFFVYGSHYRGAVPIGTIAIAVDAATAFGTGEHPSTRACLMALELLTRRRRFRKPLDIGTGTAILSIAAAKLLRRSVLAIDIDPKAVAVARHNIVCNGVTNLIKVRRAAGYCDRVIRKSRYDLILSNILARPLAVLADDLAGSLALGGRAVLSGLLRRQEPIVLAPHRGCGIVLERRILVDGWSTLILRARPRSEMAMGASAPTYAFSSGEGPVTPPCAERISPVSGRRYAARMSRACEHHRRGRRSVNGGFRYRRASDHRAPSARRKPVPAAATGKRPSRPR
jgi:ribosomal protein L11 methyltransferase